MSHYDCTDCGASMGIGYGSCHDCTPKEVFDAEKELERARIDAERAWNASPECLELERRMEEAKRLFMAPRISVFQEIYRELYDKHKPKRG